MSMLLVGMDVPSAGGTAKASGGGGASASAGSTAQRTLHRMRTRLRQGTVRGAG